MFTRRLKNDERDRGACVQQENSKLTPPLIPSHSIGEVDSCKVDSGFIGEQCGEAASVPEQGFGGELVMVGEVEEGSEGFGGINRVEKDPLSLSEGELGLGAVRGWDSVAGADEV